MLVLGHDGHLTGDVTCGYQHQAWLAGRLARTVSAPQEMIDVALYSPIEIKWSALPNSRRGVRRSG